MTEEEWQSPIPHENELIRQHKILSLQNIAACLLKTQNYVDAHPVTDEILRLDPDNKMALYRRAKAISMPINASVEDYQLALEDLAKMDSTEKRVLSEIERLKKAIAVNRKREK